MNQFAGNFDKVFKGMDVRVPTQVTEIVETNLEQARAIYEKAAENMKSLGEATTTTLAKQQALATELSNRVLENVHENVTATFDAAQKLARSRSMQDMINIQTEFVQTHGKRIAEQANANLSLAMKAGSDALTSWSSSFTGPTKK